MKWVGSALTTLSTGTWRLLAILAVIGSYWLITPSSPVAHLGASISGTAGLPRTAPIRRPRELGTPQCSLPEDRSLTAEQALRKKVELLQSGLAYLESKGSYSAQMTKQEVVGGELLPEHIIALKCRQEPFSVYLRWHTGDPGREVLYVEGKNQGRLLGHDGGWKARLPAILLSPDSALAMRDSRYPVTYAGLGGLIELMIAVHEKDLKQANYETCDYEAHVSFDGRDCHAFTTIYRDRQSSPQYRKSVTLIDREWNVPLSSQHFEWPRSSLETTDRELDAATLVESYQFTEIDFERRLTDADFDRRNEEYAFR